MSDAPAPETAKSVRRRHPKARDGLSAATAGAEAGDGGAVTTAEAGAGGAVTTAEAEAGAGDTVATAGAEAGAGGAVAAGAEAGDAGTAAAEPAANRGADPAAAMAPGQRPRASSMDSTNLPERSTHEGADRRRVRRRRSVAQIPTVVAPMDAPEDAEGRVEFIVVRAPGDRDEPPEEEETPSLAAAGAAAGFLSLGSGWVAVGALAGALVIVFLVFGALFR